jgi:hypothetical protein
MLYPGEGRKTRAQGRDVELGHVGMLASRASLASSCGVTFVVWATGCTIES